MLLVVGLADVSLQYSKTGDLQTRPSVPWKKWWSMVPRRMLRILLAPSKWKTLRQDQRCEVREGPEGW